MYSYLLLTDRFKVSVEDSGQNENGLGRKSFNYAAIYYIHFTPQFSFPSLPKSYIQTIISLISKEYTFRFYFNMKVAFYKLS